MFTKKLYLSILIYFVLNSFVYAYSIQFDQRDVTITQEQGYDRISMKHLLRSSSNNPDELGKPELPYTTINLIIPQGSEVSSVDVSSFGQRLNEKEIMLYPQQFPEMLSEINQEQHFYEPNMSVYESDELFPENLIEVVDTGDFDGVNRIVTLKIYPIQYNPRDKELIFHDNIFGRIL